MTEISHHGLFSIPCVGSDRLDLLQHELQELPMSGPPFELPPCPCISCQPSNVHHHGELSDELEQPVLHCFDSFEAASLGAAIEANENATIDSRIAVATDS